EGNGEQGVVGLSAGDVVDDDAAAVDLLRFVVAGQIRADGLPTVASIGGVEEHIATDVDAVGVLEADFDGRGPVEAVLQAAGDQITDAQAVGNDVGGDAGAQIGTRGRAVLRFRVDDVGIAGREDGILAVAAGRHRPVEGAIAGGGTAPGVIVLQATAEVVGGFVAGRHHVELLDGDGIEEAEVLAGVVGKVDAAIVALDDAVGVVGINPDGVIVAVGASGAMHTVAAIVGDGNAEGEEVNFFGVVGRHGEAAEVEGPGIEGVAIADGCPVQAGVVGLIEEAGLGLHDGVGALGITGGKGEANAAVGAGLEAGGDPGPGVAAINRTVQAAAGAAVVKGPGVADDIPHAGEQHAGVVGFDGEVNGAGMIVDEERLLPGLAAVGGVEDTALGIGAEGMAENRHPDFVGVVRVDDHTRHLPGVVEDLRSDLLPGGAGVGGEVEAVADHNV